MADAKRKSLSSTSKIPQHLLQPTLSSVLKGAKASPSHFTNRFSRPLPLIPTHQAERNIKTTTFNQRPVSMKQLDNRIDGRPSTGANSFIQRQSALHKKFVLSPSSIKASFTNLKPPLPLLAPASKKGSPCGNKLLKLRSLKNSSFL